MTTNMTAVEVCYALLLLLVIVVSSYVINRYETALMKIAHSHRSTSTVDELAEIAHKAYHFWEEKT